MLIVISHVIFRCGVIRYIIGTVTFLQPACKKGLESDGLNGLGKSVFLKALSG